MFHNARRRSLGGAGAIVLLIAVGSLLAGCTTSDDDAPEAAVLATAIGEVAAEGSPASGSALSGSEMTASEGDLSSTMTWQWQLQGELNTTYDADMYDIDLFDTSRAQITELRSDGRYVVCYFSAGSFEDWRDDADDFPAAALGKSLDGWEGERWLDIRSVAVRAVLEVRLDTAAAKGCHGVEPDNVTAVNNDTGFDITGDDQLDFNRFLAEAAHERDLTIGLKNDLDQILDLVDQFDFAVNEECNEYDECDLYKPFIDAGKPVFNAEYAAEFVASPGAVCERSATLGLATLILAIELDDSLRISCS